MSFRGCIGKETVVCPRNAVLLNNRKEWIIDTCDSVHEFLMNLVSEQAGSERFNAVWFHLYVITKKGKL